MNLKFYWKVLQVLKIPHGGVWNGLTNAASYTTNGDADIVTCGGVVNRQGFPKTVCVTPLRISELHFQFQVQSDCYLYDSQANSFSKHGSLQIAREKFSIVSLVQNGMNSLFICEVHHLKFIDFQWNTLRLADPTEVRSLPTSRCLPTDQIGIFIAAV